MRPGGHRHPPLRTSVVQAQTLARLRWKVIQSGWGHQRRFLERKAGGPNLLARQHLPLEPSPVLGTK